MNHGQGANSTLSLPDRMAIQEYCNQTKAVPFRLSSPAHKFDKVIVCSSGSTSRKYGIFPIKRPSTDDLLRGLFLRCRTKHLVLSLDDDWISPITGAEAYIPLLDLDSLDIGFSNTRIYDPK